MRRTGSVGKYLAGKEWRYKELQDGHDVTITKVCSSIGRVVVSKTIGWGFESLQTCYL